jgi:hypothetical protein
MKNFLLVFRTDYSAIPKGTPAEMETMTKRWMDWIGSIAAQNKLIDRGNRLDLSGKVVRNSVVTNGPYCEIKESIGGYSIVKASNYEEAVALAKDCPIFLQGGSVEVREINAL